MSEKLRYLWWYGVLCIGAPISIALNFLLLALHGNRDLFLSVANAFELLLTLFIVAPLVGLMAGEALWFRHRRAPATAVPLADETVAASLAAHAKDVQALEGLKRRVDALAVTNPRALDREIIAFTALGYGYIVVLIAALGYAVVEANRLDKVVPGAGRLMFYVAIGLLVMLVTALWVKFPKPEGRPLTRTGSPQFFAALDDVQRTLRVPPPNAVVLTDDVNAAVGEYPRFGPLPFSTRILIIGLPLLEALTADECKAILAHEMAHLSKRHTRRLLWVARLSATWTSLAMTLQARRHFGRALLLPFFHWYAPRFAVYAQVVARRDEYESDMIAASYAGIPATISALMRLSITHLRVAEVLRGLYRTSASSAEPPAEAFAAIGNQLGEPLTPAVAARWTERVLADRTLDAHDHPSIADRIARLDANTLTDDGIRVLTQAMMTRTESSAAETLLGRKGLARLRSEISADWQRTILPGWRQLHTDTLIWRSEGSDNRDELEVLRARARWATDCEPREVALPVVREMLRRVPENTEANVWLGQLLLSGDEPHERQEGRDKLEHVLARDSAFALLAARALEQEYARSGSQADITRVQARSRWIESRMMAGLHERLNLRDRDDLSPYPVPQVIRERIQRICALQPGLTEAFLVRKQRKFLRDQPLVVLAILFDVPWYKPSAGSSGVEATRAVLERLVVHEMADILIVVVEPRTSLTRKLRALPEARVYARAVTSTAGAQQPSSPPGRWRRGR